MPPGPPNPQPQATLRRFFWVEAEPSRRRLRTTHGFSLSNPAPTSPPTHWSKLGQIPIRGASAENQLAFQPHSDSAAPDLFPAPSSPCAPVLEVSQGQIATATPARCE